MQFFSIVFSLVVVIFLYVPISQGALFRSILKEKSEHPSKCYIELNNKLKFLKVGEEWSDDENCIRYTCQHYSKGKFLLTGAGCPTMMVVPPCYLERPVRASYPGCCGQVRCPEQKQTSQENM